MAISDKAEDGPSDNKITFDLAGLIEGARLTIPVGVRKTVVKCFRIRILDSKRLNLMPIYAQRLW